MPGMIHTVCMSAMFAMSAGTTLRLVACMVRVHFMFGMRMNFLHILIGVRAVLVGV